MGKLSYFPTAMWHQDDVEPERPQVIPDFYSRRLIWRIAEGQRRDRFRRDMNEICRRAVAGVLATDTKEGA